MPKKSAAQKRAATRGYTDEVVVVAGLFSNMLEEKEHSDVVLVSEGHEIQCHKLVLSSRSQKFKAMFATRNSTLKEGEENRKVNVLAGTHSTNNTGV